MLTIMGIGGLFGRSPLCKYSKRQRNPFLIGRRPYSAKPPKICLKDDGNEHFVVLKFKDFRIHETTVRN